MLPCGMDWHSRRHIPGISRQRCQLPPVSRCGSPLVPKPQELTWRGKAIPLSAVRIDLPPATGTDDKSRQKLIEGELTSFLRKHNVTVTPEASFRITFVREKTWSDKLREHMRSPEIAEEAYHVQATEQGISIRATHVRGFFYGMKTLEQLIIRRNGKTTLALCSISDWPDFPIRGFTNDVGRNFMPVPMIKRVIDSMADMKLNVYHFHFTENEGWRLESKLFPQLTTQKTSLADPENSIPKTTSAIWSITAANATSRSFRKWTCRATRVVSAKPWVSNP